MHWRAHSDRMQDHAVYDGPGGVVAAVRTELGRQVEAMLAAGIGPDRIVLDPGLGFSKDATQNWQLLAHLDVVGRLGLPVLVAASRKRFLADLLPEGAPPTDRDPATGLPG